MGILRIILFVVLAIWLIGFLFKIAGAAIHILLIVAAILFIIDLVSGRKSRA
ncbi:lmo0937 family membrane protein [Aneurinibacillus terranovensis]|uniref:lmo0937 family membrane protein n=1 Tax=Aneurinibacillus terranovensis TaxID=278991 RepID=UPI0003FE8261